MLVIEILYRPMGWGQGRENRTPTTHTSSPPPPSQRHNAHEGRRPKPSHARELYECVGGGGIVPGRNQGSKPFFPPSIDRSRRKGNGVIAFICLSPHICSCHRRR